MDSGCDYIGTILLPMVAREILNCCDLEISYYNRKIM
jgi:hypothetical protein